MLFLAAVVFAASDVVVARERFVTPTLANRGWGLPLYFGGQLAFALNAGPPGG